MSIGRFIYVCLGVSSFFAVGTSLFTIGLLIKRRPPRWPYYAAAKLGMVMVIGTILVLVVPHPIEIPPSPEAFIYISGVALFAFGLLGVSRDIAERTENQNVKQEVLKHIYLKDDE